MWMKGNAKKAIVALALVALSLGAGCKKKALDPFPASGAVAGWEKAGNTRVFAAKDLWQYIDGDSDHYVAAGVVSTSTSDYKYEGQVDATVDVYTMKDAAGAQKILQSDTASGAKSVPVGDEGQAFAQSVNFRKGPYLVRIVAYQDAPGVQNALLALAGGVAAKL